MRRIPWAVVVGVVAWWVLNALIVSTHLLASRAARGTPTTLAEVLPTELVSVALWIPATFLLLWWTARTPIERERWAKPLASLVLAIVVVVSLRAAAGLALDRWMDWYTTSMQSGALVFSTMLRNVLTACMIVGVGHALVYAQRARERERQAQALQERLTQARLDALSAQLNPHFLFNALNAISEMVHHDADAADRMLVQLGGLLRHSLESSRQQHTSLHHELVAIDCYLGIEQVRLGDRLRFRRDIDPEALHAQVPRLMLQPLVENAITHSVAQRATPSEIEVRAWCDGPRLVVEVRDEGAGAPAPPGFGLGLANTRDRLECLYGKSQSLDIEALREGGTRVRISLPATKGGPT